jgi:hypothetical protein
VILLSNTSADHLTTKEEDHAKSWPLAWWRPVLRHVHVCAANRDAMLESLLIAT